jgi:membrane AbrB-like protein
MAVMAQRAGADGAPVALAQTVRIAALVLVIPPAITYSGIGGEADLARFAGVADGGDLVLLVAAALLAALALRLLRVPNPWFLGPVAAGAVMAVTETTSTSVPFLAIAAGQVCLGTALGCQFTRDFLRRIRRFLKGIVVCTAFLMVACAVMAGGIAAVSDLPVAAMILATAPGSLTEMCLTAKALDLSVAMVTAFHLVRLFIVVPATPLIFDALRRFWPALVTDAAGPTSPRPAKE